MTTINSSKDRVSTAIIITTSRLYQGNVIMIAVLTLALLLLIVVIAYFMFVSW
jgi:predicted nucleic acid-binding Zn ribbon protein